MLKFTVNKNNLKEYEEKILVDKVSYVGNLININTSHPHGLRNGDFINFKRVDVNNNKLFDERFFVNVVDKSNFTIEKFEQNTLSASTCEKVLVYTPLINDEIEAIKIDLSNPSKIFTNRIAISNSVIPNEINTPTKRRCKGDLVNFNNIFLLKATNVEDNKYIEYDKTYYNTLETVYFKYRNTVISMNVLIPLTYNGYDNQNILYWFYKKNDEWNVNYLLKHYKDGTFFCEDTRFVKENGGLVDFRKDFSGNTDSYIYNLKNVLDVDFNINEKFNVSLLKKDYYKDFYVENVINENINEIVDMEKQIFIPKLERYDSNSIVNEIKINLKIRERNHGWNSTLLGDTWYGDKDNCMTTISDIGFDDSDIKQQKSSLKKSFKRLSF